MPKPKRKKHPKKPVKHHVIAEIAPPLNDESLPESLPVPKQELLSVAEGETLIVVAVPKTWWQKLWE
jgi:hypothetical protein